MRKVYNGEKEKKEKIILFIVTTNVVTSRPPECRPILTPTARPKIECNLRAIQAIGSIKNLRNLEWNQCRETNTRYTYFKGTKLI